MILTMRVFIAFFIVYLSSSFVFGQIKRPVGVNLSNVADYSTELVFTNAFLQCREWISSNASGTGPWDTGVNIPQRPDGYPVQVPFQVGGSAPQIVKTLLVWDLFSATPTGKYRLKSKGKGKIRLSNGAMGEFNSPVDVLVSVNNGVILEILSSDINDPVREIQFILPDYVNDAQNKTFTNKFTGFISDFQVIRFMDFTHTNGSRIKNWNERTPVHYYTQSRVGGVAWEYVVQLANETGKDVWINIPHLATDTYIDSLARLIHSRLNPSLKIYVEYSNELWNGAFSQHHDCAALAQGLGFTGQPWERTWKYTVKRSADVFSIFKNAYSDDQRLVFVIPSQAANVWLSEELISYFDDPLYNPHQIKPDAIAIAPYFGHDVANNLVNQNKVQSASISEILNDLENSIPESLDWIEDHKTLAYKYKLRLIAYEGGQHLVATGSNLNNDLLTQKLISTNRNAGMLELYCGYMDAWYDAAGDLFCHFNSVQAYTRYGSWGLMEEQNDTDSPKYLGLRECVFPYNQVSSAVFSDSGNHAALYISPNPASETIMIIGADETAYYEVFNSTGQLLQAGSGNTVPLDAIPSGLLFVRVGAQTLRFIKI
jgi:hypothetical protein